jgi:hypothetical protein
MAAMSATLNFSRSACAATSSRSGVGPRQSRLDLV